MDSPRSPHVLSVNVGPVRDVEFRGRTVRTGIWKSPVPGRIPIRGVNLAGDDQADRTVHGGEFKAVYVYAAEEIELWAAQLDRELEPGVFGENLTTRGVEVSTARVGERWRIGSAEFEVVQPRLPCYKLGVRFDDVHFVRTFARKDRPGAYLRVLREGDVGAGDAVEVLHRPEHDVTMALLARAVLSEPALAAQALAAPELMDMWRELLEDRL